MIEGAVNVGLEAVIALDVLGTAGRSSRVAARIDTGYNGGLTLPPDVVSRLGLLRAGTSSLELANGQEETFDTFIASVDWSGSERGVAVHEADSVSLVEMALLEGHTLNIDVRQGGRVLIESAVA